MTDDELWAALDGLFAYDSGSPGSGIHDDALKARVAQELAQDRRPHALYNDRLARLVRDRMLNDESLAEGYGLEDVGEFIRWLDDGMSQR